MLRLLLFVLPLGLDTLGVSISLGIKSQPHDKSALYALSTNCPPGSWDADLSSM